MYNYFIKEKINYYQTLKYIINISGLSIKDFAKKAKISESLIRHADDTWNPKYTTIEKICSVIHISVPSFFLIAENPFDIKNMSLNYVYNSQQIEPKDLCEKLKKIRIEKNISEGKMAIKTGFNKSNISKRENYKWVSNMLCSTLELYACCFGVSMKQLASSIYK